MFELEAVEAKATHAKPLPLTYDPPDAPQPIKEAVATAHADAVALASALKQFAAKHIDPIETGDARHRRAASIWAQATDVPQLRHAKDCVPANLKEQKRKWLSYRSKKTGKILSLLLDCVAVPRRVARGRGNPFKDRGVHDGAKCA